jgi:hypothetical protein
LGSEALVRSEDQRGALRLLDRPRDRRRLAGAGDAEQCLESLPRVKPFGQCLDGFVLNDDDAAISACSGDWSGTDESGAITSGEMTASVSIVSATT